MIGCNLCDAKVRDTFQEKWKHAVLFHPEVVLKRLMPLLGDPRAAFRLGESFGNQLQERMKRAPKIHPN